MNPLFQAGLEIQKYIQNNDWSFCFIGGLAVIRWGEIRITQDIDLCLLSGFGNEEIYIDKLIKNFKSRISDPKEFAMKNRVLLLSAFNGISIDLSLSGIDFEEEMIARASYFNFSTDCSLITCSAEDLIILKVFSDRMRDWIDVEGIVSRQADKLDIDLIIEKLKMLCQIKGNLNLIKKFKNILKKT